MSTSPEVLFVCQHGAAKSVVAARHFAKLAKARGLSIDAAAAGIEPYEAIPQNVIDGLRDDGVDDEDTAPQALTREMVENAQIVVSFGCDLSALVAGSARVIQWHDVPAVSDGYDVARTEILSRLQDILNDVET